MSFIPQSGAFTWDLSIGHFRKVAKVEGTILVIGLEVAGLQSRDSLEQKVV